MKEPINTYRRHIIRQLQYQQWAVEEHLLTCGDQKIDVFPFFKIFYEKKKSLKNLMKIIS